VINIFVLPIAFGGYLHFGEGQIDADTYVLDLPLAYGKNALALFVFLGGLSAATGMVIVATTALSIMLSNNLVLPFLLRTASIRESLVDDLSNSLIGIRRLSIGIILLLAYGYFHLVGKNYTLVSIGLISFVAVAQFAPSLLGGIYWKGGTRIGAILGLIAGFLVWAFTLTIPSMADLGLVSNTFIKEGLFGISFLKPYELFGMKGMDAIAHATFWSLLVNTLFYVLGSLYSKPTALEQAQGNLFVDIYKFEMRGVEPKIVGSSASFTDVRLLLN
jgi:Na+/proline symporter